MSRTQVPNYELARDTARDNLLTNGGFEIWQRGNGSFVANSAYTADRWKIGIAGTDTLSIYKETTNVDVGSTAAAGLAFTLGTGAGVTNLQQELKAADNAQLSNRPVTLSVRVRTSTANAVRVAIHNGSVYTYSGFHSGGGTYETLTVTATVAAAPASVVLLVFFAASCTAYVDNAMLVVGSVAADYAPLHPADDLARCLRYYEVIGDGNVSILIGGYAAAGGLAYTTLFATKKAVAPTMTKNGTWGVNNCGQPVLAGGFANGTMAYTVTATAAGLAGAYPTAAGQNITLEANP